MRKKVSRYDAIIFIIAAVSLAVFLYLAPNLFPENGYRAGADKGTILLKARSIIKDMGYHLDDQSPVVTMEHDAVQLKHLYTELGSKRAIAVMRDTIPVFQWVVSWRINQSSASGDPADKNYAEQSRAKLFLDLMGDPLQFQSDQSSDGIFLLGSEQVDRSIATILAQRVFRNDESKWVFDRMDIRGRNDNAYRRYRWHRQEEAAGQIVDLTIDVRNGKVYKFLKKYAIPKQQTAVDNDNWRISALLLASFILMIIMIIYFIIRLRNDQLDMKSGILPAVLAILGAFCWFYWNYSMNGMDEGAQAVFLMIPVLLLAGGLWIVFCVSDSLAREEWPEKLFTFDALKRRILFPETGLAITRGVALAFISLGIASVGGWLSNTYFSGYYTLSETSSRVLFPSAFRLFVIGDALFVSVFSATIFMFFLMTLLRRWFKKAIWIILPSLVILSAISLGVPKSLPTLHFIGINAVLGLIFCLFFLRFDFLTILIGSFSLPLIYYVVLMFLLGSGFWPYAIILLAVMLILFIYALRAFYSDTPDEEITGYVPDYIQRVSERERIQRELDIARHVQITFLPARNPEIPKLDIASVCLPAKEVGGDYFDFIAGPDRLGVVIGDVSGKGISAAFYMTLTKGFLKSQTQFHTSPREILVQMNKLFYENAERGMFISMIIGVFDLKASTLTFSRAGHNPMILYKSETGLAEEVEVPGMALGLDPGPLFNITIEERTVPFSKDDIFLFYTDGINEAQDIAKNEFGEEKLMHLIETHHNLSSPKLLEKIQQNLENFTAGTTQHDDITAILVKTG